MRQRNDYAYHLPPEQIAQLPADRRDASRLLAVGCDQLEDRWFCDVVALLPDNAVVVLNDTQVFPARLRTVKPTGGAVELLFLEQCRAVADGVAPAMPAPRSGYDRWHCLARSSKALRPDTRLTVLDPVHGCQSGDTVVVVRGRDAADGTVIVDVPGDAFSLLERWGEIPLPPYIARPSGPDATDRDRYQTVYARTPGAVAAPTAGLHFTREILHALTQRGCQVASLTLHVGIGTFLPVRSASIDDHKMHTEHYRIPEATAELVNSGRPVVAVGTTCVRALESAAASGRVVAGAGSTALFITPGYHFRVVDWLLTNFHLPESTLLMLVTAFAGYDRVMNAYRHAVAAGYRFFSYGDAMLLRRQSPATSATAAPVSTGPQTSPEPTAPPRRAPASKTTP